jgi:hypothetical protein
VCEKLVAEVSRRWRKPLAQHHAVEKTSKSRAPETEKWADLFKKAFSFPRFSAMI